MVLRFLPAVAAFLLCFAGGMFLPKPEARVTEVPAVALVLPESSEGLSEWMRECAKAEDATRKITEVTNQVRSFETQKKVVSEILTFFVQKEPELRKINDELVVKRKETGERDTALEGPRKQLLTAAAKHQEAMAKAGQGDFSGRLAWKKEYEKAKEDYQSAKTHFDEVRKRFEKTGEGGGR